MTALWLVVVVLLSVVLVAGLLLRRRRATRQIDAGSVSSRWLAQATLEREE